MVRILEDANEVGDESGAARDVLPAVPVVRHDHFVCKTMLQKTILFCFLPFIFDDRVQPSIVWMNEKEREIELAGKNMPRRTLIERQQ